MADSTKVININLTDTGTGDGITKVSEAIKASVVTDLGALDTVLVSGKNYSITLTAMLDLDD